jgi:2-polyprenyl-6-methoxyphenol hydroxylase-like FAD-dependent oxidoreductase
LKTDVAVIGGQLGGSTVGKFLAESGVRVTMIAKAPSPCYYTGKSLTIQWGNCLLSLGVEGNIRN